MKPLALLLALVFVSPASAEVVKTVETSAGPIAVERLVSGLDHPWAVETLPDGRLLISVRNTGALHLFANGALSQPLRGTPDVFARGQGGLLDIALHPDFADNRLVYLSYAEAGAGGAGTALGRGRLENGRIADFETIFRQEPKVPGPNHFGGRVVFSPDGKYVFLTMGERFEFDPAQDLSNHLGTIVRLNPDGSVPADNPFVGQADALDEIWSYGHRNIEGAAFHPDSGALWVVEMGPRGGDELNRVEPGRNYGWPVVSWGDHYDGEAIADHDTRPEFAAPATYWVPSISPSGFIFYDAARFADWQGHGLIGGLTSGGVTRVEIAGGKVVDEELIDLGVRVRDLEQAPDGSVYLLTEQADGKLWRLRPADR